MELIRQFNDIGREDVAIAGGKGASLGEMTRAGIPVPKGFVLLSDAFHYFLTVNKLEEKVESLMAKVDFESDSSVNKYSKEISKIIEGTEFPPDLSELVLKNFENLNCNSVAVRSSASAEDSSETSWAGELESFLNIKKDELLFSIRKCWASLYSPRAIVYRFQNKLNDKKISVAVVVQKMINSEVSGIVFTVNPMNKSEEEIVIESGYGLGEAVVGGLITPDNYIVAKDNLSILSKNISKQIIKIIYSEKGTKEVEVDPVIQKNQKLSDEKIIELAKECLNVEKHYGFGCDIEWALERGRIYILQSRPITTLS